MSARDENREAMKSTTTSELAGGVMPEGLYDEFFQEVQEQSEVLNRVRTVTLQREKMRIPKIGVGERMRQGQDEGTAPASEETPSTSSIQMDAEKGSIYWKLTSEAVEDTVDDVPSIVMDQMTHQFAVDTEDLGFNGDETGTGFVAQNDGWFTILGARGAPTYDHQADDGSGTMVNQPIDSSLFHNAIQTMESKYRRANPVFIVNDSQLQEYAYNLTDREDGLGATVLMGDSDLTPFNYDVIGSSLVPENEAIFTSTDNLIYGLYREVEVDVLTESDEVHEQDLFAKYATRVRDDFQVEDENAAVHITGIASPSPQ